MPKVPGKHRIAQVLPVGSEVSQQLVREYIGDAVSAQTLSRLTDKILGRPPVKFIFTVVLDILRTTGYNKDLMENLESRGISTKTDRTAIVKMMSDAMTEAAGYSSPLIIPSKVCAGKQVDRTRLLLAVFGHVAQGNEGGGDVGDEGADDGGEQGDLGAASETSAQRAARAVSEDLDDALALLGENEDVTLTVEAKDSSASMQQDLLKEWDKLSGKQQHTGDDDSSSGSSGGGAATAENEWSEGDKKEQVNYSALIKDAARSAYQMAESAFQTEDGRQYLMTEALVFQEIENKNLFITELERVDASDKLGAQFHLSSTIGFWGFRSRQFVSIKAIKEPDAGLKCNVPVMEAELEVGDIILRVDDSLINCGSDFAQACAGKTYMQVAYIRPGANPVPDVRFMRRARHAVEAKVRRSALNVVQVGLNWINMMTGVNGKKKKFNFIDVVVRLQKKYRHSKGINVAGAAAHANPADSAAASSRRVARRRRRKNSVNLRQAIGRQIEQGV